MACAVLPIHLVHTLLQSGVSLEGVNVALRACMSLFVNVYFDDCYNYQVLKCNTTHCVYFITTIHSNEYQPSPHHDLTFNIILWCSQMHVWTNLCLLPFLACDRFA